MYGSLHCTNHNQYTHTCTHAVLVHSLCRFPTGSAPVSPTIALFFLQFFLSSLLTCGLSSFLPRRTYVQGITIPPPCTHTPSSAALLKPVTSHVIDNIFPEVRRGNSLRNMTGNRSRPWLLHHDSPVTMRLLGSLSQVNCAPTMNTVRYT